VSAETTDPLAISMTRFHLRGGSLCGIHVFRSQLVLQAGIVEEFPIGVCLDAHPAAIQSLQDAVHYRHNESNLAVRMLPIPPIDPSVLPVPPVDPSAPVD
jgi:hypothetical protein